MKVKDIQLREITEAEADELSDGEEIKDGLLEVKFDEQSKPKDKADRWFSQTIFDEVEDSDSEEEEENSEEEADEEKSDAIEIQKDFPKGFDPNVSYKDRLKKAKDTRSRRRRLEKEEERNADTKMFFEEVSQDEDWSS